MLPEGFWNETLQEPASLVAHWAPGPAVRRSHKRPKPLFALVLFASLRLVIPAVMPTLAARIPPPEVSKHCSADLREAFKKPRKARRPSSASITCSIACGAAAAGPQGALSGSASTSYRDGGRSWAARSWATTLTPADG